MLGALALLAAFVALALSPPVQRFCCAKEWRRYPEPGGRHVIVVHRSPLFFAMPGSASDAPGFVQLVDAEGRVLQRAELDMVQNMSEPEWSVDRVEIKLIADWPLPSRGFITAERARTLALAKYQRALADRLAIQGDHGTCLPFGKITGDLELSVERQRDSWLVRHEPMVGYVFTIRVALDGRWAAVEEATFSDQ